MNFYKKNQLGYYFSIFLVSIIVSIPCFANSEDNEPGEFKISGYLRGYYRDANYHSDNNYSFRFQAVKLLLDYTSPKWLAHTEFRCYRYRKLCDFSTLVDAYLAYNFDKEKTLTVGIQPIPFGVDALWESTLYAGINNTIGLEDVHNLGLNYYHKWGSTQFDLAYFLTDGGNYHGRSRGSARYTANFVKSDDPERSTLKEKNMWMGRVIRNINLNNQGDIAMKIGASYWYSDLKNKRENLYGRRKTWALFGALDYRKFQFIVTGGRNSIKNRDTRNPYFSTMGFYDDEYDVANKGQFYTAEISYKFERIFNNLNITPYIMHSNYLKDRDTYRDSIRNIFGISFGYKDISLFVEYFLSRNDPDINGNQASLAQGEQSKRLNRLLSITLIYSF